MILRGEREVALLLGWELAIQIYWEPHTGGGCGQHWHSVLQRT